MSNIQYKCPSCSAPIEFDAALGQMRCGYCGSKFDVATVERFNHSAAPAMAGAGQAEGTAGPGGGIDQAPTHTGAGGVPPQAAPMPGTAEAAQAWKTSKPTYLENEDLAGMAALVCNSCGAEIVADPRTLSTRCGFCNNTFVVASRLHATRIPDFIIPFTIDKAAMLEAFKKAQKGKFLIPKNFKDEHVLSEATGAYIPYWHHDGVAGGSIRFRATNTRTYADDDYDVTETDVYDVVRTANVAFKGLPVCGTTKLDPGRAEGAEPFHVQQSKPFGTAYLSGYAASAYDIEAAETLTRAHERASSSLENMVQATIRGYDQVDVASARINVRPDAIWYGLLPMWLIIIEYEGKEYPFVVNGQTGEVVGTFPHSKTKLNILRACVTLLFSPIFGFLGAFIGAFFAGLAG